MTTARTIVITGASRGIGRAAADALASDGWTVIGIARRTPERFPGTFIEADLADRKQTEVVARNLAAHGHVLGIVNNVGLARNETIEGVDPEVFSSVMDLNVRPALQLTQALLPGMRTARFGRMINITSLVTRGLAYRFSYAAAKAALESITRTMAVELAADGITANAIAPGPTETELFRANIIANALTDTGGHGTPRSSGIKKSVGPFNVQAHYREIQFPDTRE